jgi:hypothetical protein
VVGDIDTLYALTFARDVENVILYIGRKENCATRKGGRK